MFTTKHKFAMLLHSKLKINIWGEWIMNRKMKKVIFLVTLLGMLPTVSAFAAIPEVNLQSGDVFLNLDYRSAKTTNNFSGLTLNSNSNVSELALDVGLGNKLSVTVESEQYKYDSHGSMGSRRVNISNKNVKATDYSLIYNVSDNISVLAGYRNFTTDSVIYSNSIQWGAAVENKSPIIGGIIVNYKLDKENKVGVYANYKTGADSFKEWTIGADYKIAPKIWLDVNYRSTEFDPSTDLLRQHGSVKYKYQGTGFGVTYKF